MKRVSYICLVIYKCGRTFTNMVLPEQFQLLQYNKEAYCNTSEIGNLKLGEILCLALGHKKKPVKENQTLYFLNPSPDFFLLFSLGLILVYQQ